MSNGVSGADIIVVQKRLVYQTYIKLIENSIGTKMFRNSFGVVREKHVDLTNDGELSCAFFVSSVLRLCDLIESVHLTVDGTEKDLLACGWNENKKPRNGSVVIYNKGFNSHAHIGFYINDGEIISNHTRKKSPQKTFYKEERELINKIYWIDSLKDA